MSGFGRLKNVPRFDLYVPPRKLRDTRKHLAKPREKSPLSSSSPVVDQPPATIYGGISFLLVYSRAPSPAILHHFAISFSWENDDRAARFLRRPPPRDINYHGGQGDERRENQGVNGRDTWRGNDRFVAMTQRLPRGGWGGGELNIHGCQKNVALLFHKRNPMPGNHYSRTILATSNPFPLKIGCSNVARRRRTISPPLSLLRVDVSEIRAPSLPLPPILLSNFRDGNHDAFPCTRQGK